MGEIEVRPNYSLQPVSPEERLEFIKKKFGKNLTPVELEYMMYMAREYELDPNKNEIYAIKYGKNPATIIVSRDGLLAIAHKTGMLDGMETRILYQDEDGNIKESPILPEGAKLLGAVCRIWRKDTEHPFEASVRIDEFYKETATWRSMPETMIKKVAEAHCLRRAFNIHGLYSEYEAETIMANQKERVDEYQSKPPSEKSLNYLKTLVSKYAEALNVNEAKVWDKVFDYTGVESVDDLTQEQVSQMIDKIKSLLLEVND